MKANSRFKKKVNEWGVVEEWIEPGDDISQKDLDTSDEEWEYLMNVNAVVEEYPEDLDPNTPLAEYYADNPEEARAAEEAKLEAMSEEEAAQQPPPSAQPSNTAAAAATATAASTPSTDK